MVKKSWFCPLVTVLTAVQVLVWLIGGSQAAHARPAASGPWVAKDLATRGAVVAGYFTGGRDVTLRRLIRTWGPPTRLARRGSDVNSCVGLWARPRARVELANYGSRPPGATACSPRYGYVQVIRTVGALWRTDRGLAVGDDSGRVVSLYPNALERRWFPTGGFAWLLRPRTVPCIGDCGGSDTDTISSVVAEMASERVARFYVGVGGAGE